MHGRQLSSRHAELTRILRNDHSSSEERKKRVARRYRKALVDHLPKIERRTMELKDKTFIVTGASAELGRQPLFYSPPKVPTSFLGLEDKLNLISLLGRSRKATERLFVFPATSAKRCMLRLL